MKWLLTFAIVLLALSTAVAQEDKKLSKKERKAAEAEENKVLHEIALNALETNQWAFESDRLTDNTGAPIDIGANPRPNVAGFDGERFFADVIFVIESRSDMVPDQIVFRQIDSNGKLLGKKTDKKGNLVYKFTSYPPTRSESTLILGKDTNRASLSLSADGAPSATYIGKVIPISKSWYFLSTERKHSKSGR